MASHATCLQLHLSDSVHKRMLGFAGKGRLAPHFAPSALRGAGSFQLAATTNQR